MWILPAVYFIFQHITFFGIYTCRDIIYIFDHRSDLNVSITNGEKMNKECQDILQKYNISIIYYVYKIMSVTSENP